VLLWRSVGPPFATARNTLRYTPGVSVAYHESIPVVLVSEKQRALASALLINSLTYTSLIFRSFSAFFPFCLFFTFPLDGSYDEKGSPVSLGVAGRPSQQCIEYPEGLVGLVTLSNHHVVASI
jgi:hypothetical protein